MCDLVESDYRILLVMGRFDIGPGFGEMTIGEVCLAHGVDTATFLAVVNTTLGCDPGTDDAAVKVSLGPLLDYLARTHDYYLTFRLPAIRRELAGALDNAEADLSKALLLYYDEFVSDVGLHIRFEEETVFPYVRSLIEGRAMAPLRIDGPAGKHGLLMARLEEMRRILIKYCPTSDIARMNELLFNIHNCEYDLASHRRVEEMLLIPAIAELERKTINSETTLWHCIS